MSLIVFMEMQWHLFILVVLFSVNMACSRTALQGLSCVNDFVSNVSCTWNSSPLDPVKDCRILGWRNNRIMKDGVRLPHLIIRSCKLTQHQDSLPGCSFSFENKVFRPFEVIPIRMECNGTLVNNITNYVLRNHIKMNPPGVPSVSSTDNETLISWNPGSPLAEILKEFNFQIQITQNYQTLMEVKNLVTERQELRISTGQLKGNCQVKVRVKPAGRDMSHWSTWSPTTSWVGDMVTESKDQDWLLDQQSISVKVVMFGSALIIFTVILVIYRSCMSKGLLKREPVPTPSKYFQTLHSVHRGNLKKWLNPLSGSASFLTTQPLDHISPVEVCESLDVVPSTSSSPSSTSVMLQSTTYPSTGLDTNWVADNSSSSASSFSNMGYFVSSSSSSSVQTDPSPAYFTHQDNIHKPHSNQHLPLPLRFYPSFNISPRYESLSREPQSPDLPLPLPVQMCPLSFPPSVAKISSDSQHVDQHAPVANDSNAAWPVAGVMYRSSSMPVESCKMGYFTLKELQATFSNESI